MKTILIVFIKFYKRAISPYLPKACRFTPTCSVYAIEALERFGVIRGTLLAAYRVLRCNPFCRGGYDPVPERFTFKRQQATELAQSEEPPQRKDLTQSKELTQLEEPTQLKEE